jgi:hypothetical protein
LGGEAAVHERDATEKDRRRLIGKNIGEWLGAKDSINDIEVIWRRSVMANPTPQGLYLVL